jgi:hypothetical protein
MQDKIFDIESVKPGVVFVPGKGYVAGVKNPQGSDNVNHLLNKVIIIDDETYFITAVEYQSGLTKGFPLGCDLYLVVRKPTIPELMTSKNTHYPEELQKRNPQVAKFLLELERITMKHGISITATDMCLVNYERKHRAALWNIAENIQHPIQGRKTK